MHLLSRSVLFLSMPSPPENKSASLIYPSQALLVDHLVEMYSALGSRDFLGWEKLVESDLGSVDLDEIVIFFFSIFLWLCRLVLDHLDGRVLETNLAPYFQLACLLHTDFAAPFLDAVVGSKDRPAEFDLADWA